MLHIWPARSDAKLYVLLHGFTGAVSAWDEVVSGLDGAAWGVHLPGHHPHSPAPRLDASFDDVADGIAAHLSARLRGRQARLVGYSLGARLALSLMLRHPRLWACGTLIGCHPGLRDAAARSARADADARWEDMLRRQMLADFNRAWAAQPLFASQQAAAPHRLAAQEAARAAHDPPALAAMLRATSLARMPERWSALGGLAMLSTWVAGAADAKFTALAQQAAGMAPHGRCVTLAGVGHNPLLEAPARVAALLCETS